MKLADLPVDLLACILKHPYSWAAIELWKCGDPLLQYKLANGGIKDVILEHPCAKGLAIWPRCLKEFKLRSLSIKRDGGLGPPSVVYGEIRSLYTGIKKLEIICNGALEAFFHNMPRQFAPQHFRATSESKRAKLQEADDEPLAWDWKETFLDLAHLATRSPQSPPSLRL